MVLCASGPLQVALERRRETESTALKSDKVLDRLVTRTAVTHCAISGCLGWHAGPVTTLCEARSTTSPTSVARMIREGVHGLCQQDGGGGARQVPHG